MKQVIRLGVTILACATFLIAPSCSSKTKHTHTWKNYIVKAPTCTENGLMEKLCDSCGEKEYEDIMPSGHNFVNDACTICGQAGKNEVEVDPIIPPNNSNNAAAWSLDKIYQYAKKLGVEDDYATFIWGLEFGYIDNLYIDNLGLLHVNAHYTSLTNKPVSLPLASAIGRVSPANAQANDWGYINKIQIVNNQLTITYADGIQREVGRLTNNTITITKFGINTDNEFVIYYSDNTIAFAGKVSEGRSSSIQSAFVYRTNGSGYAIYQVVNTDDKIITLPISHQGNPINFIDEDAFTLLGQKTVSILIPESIINIHENAFRDLSENATLYFEGDAAAYANVDFTSTAARKYFKGEWSYVNGIPAPNV